MFTVDPGTGAVGPVLGGWSWGGLLLAAGLVAASGFAASGWCDSPGRADADVDVVCLESERGGCPPIAVELRSADDEVTAVDEGPSAGVGESDTRGGGTDEDLAGHYIVSDVK